MDLPGGPDGVVQVTWKPAFAQSPLMVPAATRPPVRRRALLLGALVAGTALAAPAQADVVPCFDAERGIVQRKRAHACSGDIVSEARAAEIREERQRRRLRALRPGPGEPGGDGGGREPRDGDGRGGDGRSGGGDGGGGDGGGRGQSGGATPPERGATVRTGSGFPVGTAGHIVTARHAVAGCGSIRIATTAGAEAQARVVARAPRADLAVLATARTLLPPVPLPPAGGAAVARPGERVTAIGYPEQGLPRIRPFVVHGPVVEVNQRGAAPEVIAFRARVRRGNSGGPLFGENGRLLGVVVAKVDTPAVYRRTGEVVRNLAFAYSMASLRPLLAAAEVPLAAANRSPLSTDVAEARTVRVICRAGPAGGA